MQEDHLPSTVTGTRLNLEKVNLIYCHSKQISIMKKKGKTKHPSPHLYSQSFVPDSYLLPSSKSGRNIWILKSSSVHKNSLLLLPPPIFPIFSTQSLPQATGLHQLFQCGLFLMAAVQEVL